MPFCHDCETYFPAGPEPYQNNPDQICPGCGSDTIGVCQEDSDALLDEALCRQ